MNQKKDDNIKNVLLLNDMKTGHFNQTLAVSFALDKIYRTKTETATIKINRFSKYILRFILNSVFFRKLLKNKDALSYIKYFYDIDIPLKKYDIIVSSGKDTSLLNAWLSLAYGSYNIYSGNPKKLNHLLFDVIFTVLEHGFENEIVLDVAPTISSSGDLDSFCKNFHLERNLKYTTLLIGGDGSGYSYDESVYDKIINFINSTQKNINWLVSTSRRTPLWAEKNMQKKMKTEMFVAYNQKPQKIVSSFLALSDTVFVTEESASMIGEAIASQKKVVTIYPKNKNPKEDYQKILSKYTKSKKIYSTSIERLDSVDLSKICIEVLKLNSTDEIVKKLKNKFDLKKERQKKEVLI